MQFNWETFDITFLKSIIEAADDVEYKELYLRTDDKDSIVGCVKSICEYPNKRYMITELLLIMNCCLNMRIRLRRFVEH